VQSPTTTWDSDCSTRFSSQFAIHPPSCFWTKSQAFESDFKEDTLDISWPGFSVVFMLSDEMPDLNLDKPRCRKQFGRVEAIAPTPVLPLIAPRTAMPRGMDDPVPSRDVSFDILCLMWRSSTPDVWHDSSPFSWVQATGNNLPGPVWLTHRWKGITQVYRAAASNQHTFETSLQPTTGKVIPVDWKVVQRSQDGHVLTHKVTGCHQLQLDLMETISLVTLHLDLEPTTEWRRVVDRFNSSRGALNAVSLLCSLGSTCSWFQPILTTQHRPNPLRELWRRIPKRSCIPDGVVDCVLPTGTRCCRLLRE
jgi:hypothetical protein